MEGVIADLHIHSRFSRACSKDLNLENLEKWARVKGLGLLGTGDFTHPEWLEELKNNLEEREGILYSKSGFKFILTGEVSLIYTQEKGRRVHLVLLAPDFEAVDKINSWLDTKGRRNYDGRPIFKISCEDFTAKMNLIDDRIEIIPAHCLLPDAFVHTQKGMKKIRDIKKDDFVLTHKGRFQKVGEVFVHKYNGNILRIVPWYFSEGLETTPEHPYFAIKSYKKCKSTKGLCKPLCSQVNVCARRYFNNYKKEWVQAKDIEVSDFLVYPRFKEEKDIEKIDLTKFIGNFKIINENFLIHKNARNHTGKINRFIDVNKNFCRLLGYFLSEGYLISNQGIGFCFNSTEKKYIKEVISFIKESFGFDLAKRGSRRRHQGDIIFSSKLLNSFFGNFYFSDVHRANTKFLLDEFIYLPKEKIAEIFRGWWRGDTGNTISRQLANQMKLICLKLGVIPSIRIDKAEDYNRRGKHFIDSRKIKVNHDLIVFSNLSFFERDYGMFNENCFKKFINKLNRKHGWVDEQYVYLPVRKIEEREYNKEVYNLEVEKDNSYVSEFACIHNCWTPWFGLYGSESGFDSLKDAFGSQADRIHAIETGMSSSPEMNWKISELNNKTIVSFSDSHSFWPWRIGREATIFKNAESYDEILREIRENDILGTIEVDPAYGKYHWDGHRGCGFSCSPNKTKEMNGKCPECGKDLIIGVENRVDELSNQEMRDGKKFYKILPLHEIISFYLKSGLTTKKVWDIYNKLIERFATEFNVLLNAEKTEMSEIIDDRLTELIMKNREGKIRVKPGYDGVYGEVINEQTTLF